MEIILKQDVDKLGKSGQVVRVKDGFARNFLIPNGLAVPVTAANIKLLEQQRQKKVVKLEKVKKEAEALKERLSTLSLTIPVLAQEEEGLYGSVAATDIVHALKEEGFQIEKSSLEMQEPIRSLGIYEVPVKLHPEVTAKVKVWVVKK
jgi:large subunit ribosomal protein L9